MSEKDTFGAAGEGTIPLSVPVLRGSERAYVDEALSSGWVSSAGKFVELFEERLVQLTGSPHVVATVNGTSALHVALMLAGVEAGDLVIVPALTFVAPVNTVRYVGADPVFLGCDEFLNLDPQLLSTFLAEECEPGPRGPVERASGRRVAAVVPVHVFGNPCEMAAISRTCSEHGVELVEDASESVGSRWSAGELAGRHTGTVGRFGALSFNGNKIATCGGGGALLCARAEDAERARYLTTQAKDDAVRYLHGAVGYNYRLTNVAAAIGVAQLEQLPGFIEHKRSNWERYRDLLADAPGLELLGKPEGTEPNWWFYSLLVEPAEAGVDREALMSALSARSIQTRPLWYPNHLQAPFSGCQAYGIERATSLWERVLNLPCSSDLDAADVARVAEAILGEVMR